LILDAAERVFAERLPDSVGLKEIGHEAGVTHGLVTHYFGTYDALVEATLERRIRRTREGLIPVVVSLLATDADASSLLQAYRDAVRGAASDPATVRLGTWAMMSGRAAATDFFPHREQGLKLFVDALESRSNASREDLEFLVMVSFSLAVTWELGGGALSGALGHKQTPERTAAFARRTAALVSDFLRAREPAAAK
jgi:AcrR family transcriptional regulator